MTGDQGARREGTRRVAIVGASGFLGAGLAGHLRANGHTVVTVGRGANSDVRWDPARGVIDAKGLAGVDAVVNLAGSTIGERWTARRRVELRESRVRGTRLLCEALAALQPQPAVLVSGSAIGIYGSRGDEWLDEQSALGDDFLSGIARDWEGATLPARDAGIRVVLSRTGIVLHPAGGALKKLLLPFLLGAGGKLGNGRQWMSWVSRTDWVSAIDHAMRTPTVDGPMNLVAPEPVTNETFTETLGRILRRPTLVPVPAVALRLVFGEMADGTVLASQRVRPAVLEASGFRFAHPTLSSALRAELGRP